MNETVRETLRREVHRLDVSIRDYRSALRREMPNPEAAAYFREQIADWIIQKRDIEEFLASEPV